MVVTFILLDWARGMDSLFVKVLRTLGEISEGIGGLLGTEGSSKKGGCKDYFNLDCHCSSFADNGSILQAFLLLVVSLFFLSIV